MSLMFIMIEMVSIMQKVVWRYGGMTGFIVSCCQMLITSFDYTPSIILLHYSDSTVAQLVEPLTLSVRDFCRFNPDLCCSVWGLHFCPMAV